MKQKLIPNYLQAKQLDKPEKEVLQGINHISINF